jgi:hypothetical protein
MSEYRLHLRSTPCGVPVEIRLRRLLKAALRAFQFRCVSIQQIDTTQASVDSPPTITPSAGSTPQTGGKREGRGTFEKKVVGPSGRERAESGAMTGFICTQTRRNFRELIDTPSESAGK